MKVVTSQSPRDYTAGIKDRLDSPFSLGRERFTGVCLGRVFFVSYFSGEEFGRRNYPIMNQAVGFVGRRGEETIVSYVIFRGLTAPASLTAVFLLSLLIFKIVDAPQAVYFAGGWTAAVALLTFLCTVLSETGRSGTDQLKRFLSPDHMAEKGNSRKERSGW